MKLESLSRLRRPLRILLGISVLVICLCLMWACLSIRFSVTRSFSRESVAEAFRAVSLPIYLCLGLAFLSALAQLLPCSAEVPMPERPLRMTLARMQERTDPALCPEEMHRQILSLRSTRKLYARIGKTVLVLSCVLFLIYGLNSKNFHPTLISRSMLRAMIWLIPCSVVPFGLFLFIGKKNRESMAEELELLKSAPKESRIAPPRHRSNRRLVFFLRMGVLFLGLLFLVYGFFAGGSADVLTKAANICTECIGLG